MNEREWYYVKDGQRYGPVPQAKLIELLQEKTLGPATLVWTRLMGNWREASTIDFSAPPVALHPFRPERPAPVTVFGILNIVFGSLGLLCAPLELIVILAMPQVVNLPTGARASLLFSAPVGFGCSVLLIVVGIGLLYLRAWARVWCLGYGWFAIVWGIVGMVVHVGFVTSGDYGYSHDAIAAMVGGVIGVLAGLVYPILLVVFMRRPNVKDACTR
jgi:hypothetical protein